MTGFQGEMRRAFEVAMTTLHFSDHHEAKARQFFADGMNNRAGHLSPYMASKVIAATFAAVCAFKIERNAVTSYINRAADSFAGVPVQWPAGPQRQEAMRYSVDAVTRYHALADHIQERDHLRDSDGPRMAETNEDSARGEAGPARAEGIAQGQQP